MILYQHPAKMYSVLSVVLGVSAQTIGFKFADTNCYFRFMNGASAWLLPRECPKEILFFHAQIVSQRLFKQ